MQTVPQTPLTPSPAPRDLGYSRRPQNYFLPLDVSSRFGVRLRQLRRDHQMTQLRLAVEFGIDRTFISDVERGRKSISLPMLEVLALGFQLSLSELLRDI
ncbi:MAG: helix-turn-helix domain-containing protein [Janthinobacterium lividum]